MTSRPPSARDQPDNRFDQLHEGVPPWLAQPLVAWVEGFLVGYPPMGGVYYEDELIHDMELAVRFDPPLSWTSAESAVDSIRQRFTEDSPEAIDVLEFLLGWLGSRFPWQPWTDRAGELKRILDTGGSAWDVTASPDAAADDERERYVLTRRVAGPAFEVIAAVGFVSERAGQHLREAWGQLLGVRPDPSAAYQSAVAAVEVAAKPVVTPNDPEATLGRIRGQLSADVRDHPDRWTFELGDVEIVVSMISALWETQLRHGDETAPLSETQEEADAAVHLALTLVRWFTTGAVRK